MSETLVVIIDPVTPARFGLKSLLENHEYGFSVVKTYPDILSFKKATNRLADIILINPYVIGFPNPFNIRELLPDNPSTMIIAMTNEHLVPASLSSFDGTLNIYEDEQGVAEKLVELHKRFLSNENTTGHHNLTQREEAILIDLYNGLGNQEIADKLCVSIHTVRAHRRNLLSKTQIKCVAQFVAYVRKHNLIEFCAVALGGSLYAAFTIFQRSFVVWR